MRRAEARRQEPQAGEARAQEGALQGRQGEEEELEEEEKGPDCQAALQGRHEVARRDQDSDHCFARTKVRTPTPFRLGSAYGEEPEFRFVLVPAFAGTPQERRACSLGSRERRA